MDRSLNAALLSGLVCPGAGQFYLGRRARGLVFLAPTLVAAGYFLSKVLEPVMAIAGEIERGAMALDPVTIALRIHEQGVDAGPLMSVAALVMIVCWVAGTIDAWLLGRRA